MNRRRLLTYAAAAIGGGMPSLAHLQESQAKTVRIVNGFGPGSTAEVVTRLLAPHLQQELGQSFVVDNVQGAAGNIAAQTVAKARPDGYTLLMAVNSMFGSNAYLLPSEQYDLQTAFTPILPVSNIGLILVAGPAAPAQTLEGVLEASMRGVVAYGTPGIGTSPHLVAEMLRERTQGKLSHIPYKGGLQMANDVVAGQIALGFAAYTPVAGFISAGRLKPLAVCGARRLAALPEVRTVSEIVPGISMTDWCGLVAPKGTPDQVCAAIAAAGEKALARKDLVARMVELGADPLSGSAEDLRRMIKTEHESKGDIIRRLGIRTS